jgi:hypothetical protein
MNLVMKAEDFRVSIFRWQHDERRRKERESGRPCPYKVKYDTAVICQYAVIWSLQRDTSGRSFRLTDGLAVTAARTDRRNSAEATRMLVEVCPTIQLDRGREMVDAMLVYIEPQHRDWFWRGMQGDRHAHSFLRYQARQRAEERPRRASLRRSIVYPRGGSVNFALVSSLSRTGMDTAAFP